VSGAGNTTACKIFGRRADGCEGRFRLRPLIQSATGPIELGWGFMQVI
jgi:hypothetical protein